MDIEDMLYNLLWFGAGVCATLIATKLKKTDSKATADNEDKPQPRILPEPKVIQVAKHPQGTAKEAFIANVSKFTQLFESLSKDENPPSQINEIIVGINNKELMDIWSKIHKNNAAILRILAMWGIRKEDEMKFLAQPYHLERYDVINDSSTIIEGMNYTVLSPCWLLTITNENGIGVKQVVKKGSVKAI